MGGARVEIVDGVLLVDGRPLVEGESFGPAPHVQTGPDSRVVMVMGEDAFLLRESTEVAFRGDETEDGFVVQAFTLVSGAILSVFGPKPVTIDTPVATIGIRGTGIYLEAGTGTDDYACLCYGKAAIALKGHPEAREDLTTSHHDEPRFLRPDAPKGARLTKAPVQNHSDAELVLLESLVGRVPPFTGKPGLYDTQPDRL